MRGHVPPLGPVVNQLPGHHWHHAKRHGEHDAIEVDTAAKHPLLGVVAGAEVRLEPLDPVLGLDLLRQWPVRKDGKPVHPCQWLVVVHVVGKPYLSAHRDRVDVLATRIEVQCVDAMEELEFHTAPAQYLVDGGDDDVTHTGGHLPEDRTLVGEQQHPEKKHPDTRADLGPFQMTLLVPEHHVVHGA